MHSSRIIGSFPICYSDFAIIYGTFKFQNQIDFTEQNHNTEYNGKIVSFVPKHLRENKSIWVEIKNKQPTALAKRISTSILLELVTEIH